MKIYNGSESSFKMLVPALMESEHGVVFFHDDMTSLLTAIEMRSRYDEPMRINDGKYEIAICVIPVRYCNDIPAPEGYRIDCRDYALRHLYKSWSEKNGKPADKEPYDYKEFINYAEKIGTMSCDFVVAMV